MDIKQRILRFITYYATQEKGEKTLLKNAISTKCDFNGGTFDFRKKKMKYSEAEMDAIELIVEKHKKGELENVEIL